MPPTHDPSLRRGATIGLQFEPRARANTPSPLQMVPEDEMTSMCGALFSDFVTAGLFKGDGTGYRAF